MRDFKLSDVLVRGYELLRSNGVKKSGRRIQLVRQALNQLSWIDQQYCDYLVTGCMRRQVCFKCNEADKGYRFCDVRCCAQGTTSNDV